MKKIACQIITVILILFVNVSCSLNETSKNSKSEDNKKQSVSSEIDSDGNECFPEDKSKEVMTINCTGCHSARLVCQQGMSRKRWDETITWMQEEQNLWEFEPDTRKEILDYLEKHFGQDLTEKNNIIPAARVAPLAY